MKVKVNLKTTRERFLRRALLLSTPADHMKRATQEGDLRKCLGLPELTFLGTGSIIGAGVFVLSGVAAKESAGPSVILSYIVAALAALLSAFAYSEFACDVPVAGGAFNYISITFGELAAWTTGWNMILETTLSSAAVSRGFASYLCTLFGRDPSTLRPSLGPFQLDFVALGLICLLSVLLAAGTHLSAKFNMSVSISVMACILFVLCAGFPVASASNLSPFFPRGVRGMFSAASMVFFAFVGFDYVANAAEEARNPTRDLPISIVVSLAVATLLYVLMSTAIVAMVPTPLINVHAPFSDAFLQHGMLAAARLVSVGALLGIVTSTMTGLLSQARLYVVLGRQCLLPSWLAGVHKKRGTPVRATVLTAAFAGVLALLLDIDLLAELVSIGTLYVFMMVCCGVLWRRYHQPGSAHRAAHMLARLAALVLASAGFSISFTFGASWPLPAAFLLLWLGATLSCYALPVAYRPPGFRMPLSPLSPALGVLFTIHLIGSLGWMAYVRFGVWMLLGFVIYAGYGVHAADEREHQEAKRRLDPEDGDSSDGGSGSDGDGDGGRGQLQVELPRLSSLDPEGPLHRGAVGEGAAWDAASGGDSERLRLLKRLSGSAL